MRQKLKEYINTKSPQYKVIYKYKLEKLEDISPRISDTDLEIELFKISQELNCEIKKQGKKFLNKKISDINKPKGSWSIICLEPVNNFV